MNDAKMCKAMQAVCMNKRNNERLRHVFVKDGRMYATDHYMIVAVQDEFTESHGHDGIEILKETNGLFEIAPDENVSEMPNFEKYFGDSRRAPFASRSMRFKGSFIKKAYRVFEACGLVPYIEIGDDYTMNMSACDGNVMVMAVISGMVG